MRNLLFYVVLSLLLFSGASFAELKIAFVNQKTLLEGAPQVGAAESKLRSEFSKRTNAIQQMQKKIKDNIIKLDKDQALMTKDAVDSLEREINSLRRDFARDKKALDEDISIRQNEELIEIQKVVMEAIKKVADRDKYDLIIGDGVIHASKRIDITAKILTELKSRFKPN